MQWISFFSIRPFGYFFSGVSPPLFGLERGPITPPGPAMVLTDRKDLNSNKTKQNYLNLGSFAPFGPLQAYVHGI